MGNQSFFNKFWAILGGFPLKEKKKQKKSDAPGTLGDWAKSLLASPNIFNTLFSLFVFLFTFSFFVSFFSFKVFFFFFLPSFFFFLCVIIFISIYSFSFAFFSIYVSGFFLLFLFCNTCFLFLYFFFLFFYPSQKKNRLHIEK